MRTDPHNVLLLEPVQLRLTAHGEVWSMKWSELNRRGGVGAVGSMRCPVCGAMLNDTSGAVTVGVPVLDAEPDADTA